MTTLADATENSTYIVTISCLDETGAAMTPTSCAWTLTDGSGNVVNSRSAVALTPATSMNIVLLTGDLEYSEPDSTGRYLTVSAVYTSTYGTGLALKQEYFIPILPLRGA
jgi:hypothetical protein